MTEPLAPLTLRRFRGDVPPGPWALVLAQLSYPIGEDDARYTRTTILYWNEALSTWIEVGTDVPVSARARVEWWANLP